MEDTKGLLQSKTVWAAIIGLLATMLQLLGAGDIFGDSTQQAQLVDAILIVVQAVAYIATAVFRLVATKSIGKT